MQSNVTIAWRGMDGAGFQYGFYREGEKQYRVDISLPGRGATPNIGPHKVYVEGEEVGAADTLQGAEALVASFLRCADTTIWSVRSRAPGGGSRRCCTPWPAVQAGGRRLLPGQCRLPRVLDLNRSGGSLAPCSPAKEAAGDERQ